MTICINLKKYRKEHNIVLDEGYLKAQSQYIAFVFWIAYIFGIILGIVVIKL